MEELSIINKSYELYKEMAIAQKHLKKPTRNSLGISSKNSVLEFIECAVMAKNAPKTMKAAYLIRASAHLEVLTLKLRLLLELKEMNETRIFQMQAKTAEIGRMLGGWLKSLQSL